MEQKFRVWRIGVSRKMRLLAIVVVFGIVSLYICRPAVAGRDKIIARYGDKTMTVSELEKIVSLETMGRQKLDDMPARTRDAILDKVVRMLAVADYARSKGIDKNPDVKEQLRLLTDNFVASAYLRLDVADKASKDFTEKDLKVYYQTHQDEFKTPEMVKARRIVVRVDKGACESSQKAAKEKAEEILKKIKDGADFAKLASEFSDDEATRVKGGELGFMPKGKMVPAFDKAVFSAKPGDVVGPIRTSYGLDIVKVEAKKPASVEPFDKVKDEVKQKATQDIQKSKVKEAIDRAMKKMKVQLYPEVLTKK